MWYISLLISKDIYVFSLVGCLVSVFRNMKSRHTSATGELTTTLYTAVNLIIYYNVLKTLRISLWHTKIVAACVPCTPQTVLEGKTQYMIEIVEFLMVLHVFNSFCIFLRQRYHVLLFLSVGIFYVRTILDFTIFLNEKINLDDVRLLRIHICMLLDPLAGVLNHLSPPLSYFFHFRLVLFKARFRFTFIVPNFST